MKPQYYPLFKYTHRILRQSACLAALKILVKAQKVVHHLRMSRSVNEIKWKIFVAEIGGVATATLAIMKVLECSMSKADKLARCKYPSLPTPTEQKALARIFRCKRDDIYPLVAASSDKDAA